jgi:GTP cyclohydrolase I
VSDQTAILAMRDTPLSERPSPGDPPRAQEAEDAIALLVKKFCPEWAERGFALDATPARAARAWAELTCGYQEDPADYLTTFERDGYDELVLQTGIPFYSLCEHHLLPFVGKAHVGYLPGDRICGLSKLDRLVDTYARRLQVQERMTSQIADALEAEHLCKAMRGVRKPGTSFRTSAVRGALREKPEARAEAFALIRGGTP